MNIFTIVAAVISLSSSDRSYLTNAMQAELGRYALAASAQKRGDASVKAFGKTLAVNSAARTSALDALARASGVPIPKKPLVRDSFHYAQLSGMHGSRFDRVFIMDMRIDDEMLLSREQSEARHGNNARLKALASKRAAALRAEIAELGRLK